MVCVGLCVAELLIPFVPLQPPEAEHEVAFVVLHESVVEFPCVIPEGEAESVSVGAGRAGVVVVAGAGVVVGAGAAMSAMV